jgi:polysaccharide biosynthesis protein PelA
MKKLALLFIFLLFPATGFAASERFVVYYGDKLPAEKFADYDVIVFDSDAHPDLAPLKGKTLLGYVNIGEAENYRSDFKELKKQKLFLGENKAWKDHAVIDIRKSEWKNYVLDILIPKTLQQGFSGVMLDAIESPLQRENDNAQQYSGMHEAAADLIGSIRVRFPDIKIMLNRGFEILPQVAEDIDMVMAETIYTDWQPGQEHPIIQPEKTYDAYVAMLAEAKRAAPALKIYTLDYWPAKDAKQVSAIVARQREEGFIPYVAPSLDLQTLGKVL